MKNKIVKMIKKLNDKKFIDRQITLYSVLSSDVVLVAIVMIKEMIKDIKKNSDSQPLILTRIERGELSFFNIVYILLQLDVIFLRLS